MYNALLQVSKSGRGGRRGENSSARQHQDAIFGVWTAPKQAHTHPLLRKVPVTGTTTTPTTTSQEPVTLAAEVLAVC